MILNNDDQSESGSPNPSARLHIPCLILGISCMLLGTFTPFIFTNSEGKVDHIVATLVFISMAAGFVRGVGYIPTNTFAQVLFGGWSAFISFAIGAGIWILERSH